MANERRLIDMDETIKQLRDYADRKHANGHTDTGNGILKAVSYIRNNMVRVDAVEVVRCRDCKNSDQMEDGGRYCHLIKDCRKPNDYCSCGKRGGTQPQREDV